MPHGIYLVAEESRDLSSHDRAFHADQTVEPMTTVHTLVDDYVSVTARSGWHFCPPAEAESASWCTVQPTEPPGARPDYCAIVRSRRSCPSPRRKGGASASTFCDQEVTEDMGATLTCSDAEVRHASTRRLVIVAERSLIVEAIRIGFRKSGEFTLVGYADGRNTTAAAILGAAPDVILLDDMARSERGLALLRAIRAKDQDVAVFVVSMHLDAEWLDRAFGAGATSVISKATHPTTLVTLVRETLNGHIVHRPTGEVHARKVGAPSRERRSRRAHGYPHRGVTELTVA